MLKMGPSAVVSKIINAAALRIEQAPTRNHKIQQTGREFKIYRAGMVLGFSIAHHPDSQARQQALDQVVRACRMPDTQPGTIYSVERILNDARVNLSWETLSDDDRQTIAQGTSSLVRDPVLMRFLDEYIPPHMRIEAVQGLQALGLEQIQEAEEIILENIREGRPLLTIVEGSPGKELG